MTTKTIPATPWESEYDGPFNERSIREKFVPSSHFRVVRHCYPPHTEFGGAMRAGRCFVLRGCCRYDFGHSTATLVAGQFADLPAGSYELETTGDGEFESVMCFALPPGFRGEGEGTSEGA